MRECSLVVQPEEQRYRSVCQQLSDLNAHLFEQSSKKSLTNKLIPDETQVSFFFLVNFRMSIFLFRLGSSFFTING